MIRILTIAALFALGGALYAQASLAVSGSLADDEEQYLTLDIDFGTSTSHTIAVDVTGDSTTEGLDVFFGDLDEMAANGTATSVDTGQDAGTGTVSLSVSSATYTGVHQFILNVSSATGSGPVNFSGSVDCTTLSAGDITLASQESVVDFNVGPVLKLTDRAVKGKDSVGGSGNTIEHEFLIDFGGTAQTATFLFMGSGSVTGDIELFEILANGTTSSLTTVSGTANWNDEANVTTSSRSGVVRFRVVADTASMDYDWSAVLGTTVTTADFTELVTTGSLTSDQERLHAFSIDFGGTSTVMLQFGGGSQSGSIDVLFVDLDELATNGSANAFTPANEHLTLTGSGVREYAISYEEDGMSTASYNYTWQFSVASGDLASIGTKTLNDPQPLTNLLHRGVRSEDASTSGGTITRDFNVDFGGMSHAANFWLQAACSADAFVNLYEIDSMGTPQVLTTLSLMAGIEDETNDVTMSRQGIVTFRVEIVFSAPGQSVFNIVFDNSVTVQTIGSGDGGGDGDDDDGGCTSGTSQSWWMLLGLVAAGLAAVRLRRTHVTGN